MLFLVNVSVTEGA